MKTINKRVDCKVYGSKAFEMYFRESRIAVFDIETTGLYPNRDKLILSGIVFFSPKEPATCMQYFADSIGDERNVVESTIEALSRADLIVTYNGASFDLPFLRTRAGKYGVDANAITAIHLDIYNLVKHYSDIKRLIGSLRQKNLEYYMGISDKRSDKISGAESVAMYEEYLNVRSRRLEDEILLHNSDDIIQLAKLIPVIEKTDFHRAMSRVGFIAGDYMVDAISVNSSAIDITASCLKKPFDYISFPTDEKPYTVMSSSTSNRIDISIPVETPAKGVHVIDVQKLLPAASLEELKRYPAFEAGYLIAKADSSENNLEINLFVREFLENLSIF